MKQLATVISAFLLTLIFIACGESYLVDDNAQPTLNQHIFVLSDRLIGQPYNYGSPVTTVYLDTSETVKFWAAYSLDGRYISSDTAEDHFLGHNWSIDGSNYNISPLRFKFATPGFRQGVLETVDLLNDTLRDTVNIFVNTPISIGIVAPVNGFNQVNPNLNSRVELRWSIAGLDPWEESVCYIYAAYDRESVWDNAIGWTECDEPAALNGNFLGDSLTRYIMEHPEQDTSVAIYWGVKAFFYTEDGFEERDSTDIFSFSTRYMHDTLATITIPIVYDNLRSNQVNTSVVITSSTGELLDEQYTRDTPATITSRITAQTGVRIHVYDNTREEFEASDITINTLPGTKTIIDTIHLQDRIQPQVAVLQDAIGFNDSVAFYILDNGTGINPNRIHVTEDSDTLDFNYEEPFIKFKSKCFIKCRIRISVEDYAHNANPRVYWESEASKGFLDTLYIRGPFTEISGGQ